MIRALFLAAAPAAALSLIVSAQAVPAPKIWDDKTLADWATPVAGLYVRPAHYSSAEYYAAPVENLRTYPVYHPDAEPPGYWDELRKKKPELLIDASEVRTAADWVKAGERAFREMDNVFTRTDDPALIAQARDPRSFEGFIKLPDGTAWGPRWVVTDQGVMLTVPACGSCHRGIAPTGALMVAGPGGTRAPGSLRFGFQTPLTGPGGTALRLQRTYQGDSATVAFWREFTTPWAPDERVERTRSMTPGELKQQTNQFGGSFGGGVFARANASPFFVSKITDLQNLRYSRYLDATATHRLRGPEDVARYAALVSGADSLDFGPHRILTDQQRHVRFRYADELLYAIGVYLMSLEAPRNAEVAPSDVLVRGEQVFRREACATCHTPPDYTNGKLTVAEGWHAPPDHPNRDDIMPVSVGTDPGLALRTRKGTGLYKIPSLRGIWYRPRLLHDGSLASLEEMFDRSRLSPTYVSKGWNPPGTTTRAIRGHLFGLEVNADDKAALLAFLRSL